MGADTRLSTVVPYVHTVLGLFAAVMFSVEEELELLGMILSIGHSACSRNLVVSSGCVHIWEPVLICVSHVLMTTCEKQALAAVVGSKGCVLLDIEC